MAKLPCSARVIYSFAAVEANDLAVDSGETIIVERMINDEWAACRHPNTGKCGIVPVAFLELIDDTTIHWRHDNASLTRSDSTYYDAVDSLPSSDQHSSQGEVDCRRYVRAKYAFSGQFAGELSFVPNQIIRLNTNIDAEWMEGECDGKVGIFPRSYVELIDNQHSQPRRAVAIYSFTAIESDDLSVQCGDRLIIDRMINSEWALCRNERNIDKSGIVPVAFLQLDTFDDDWSSTVDRIPSRQSSRPPRPDKPPSRLNRSSLMNTDQLSTNKVEQLSRARLKVIEDLIQSEQQYLADITACERAIETDSSGCIDRSALLPGLASIRELSTKLLQAFRDESTDSSFICFGSVFLRFLPEFQRVYGMYWECSETAIAYLEKCDQDPMMKPIIVACFRSMQANGCSCIDIYSAIGRPIQRILKYPLFLSELRKCTDITHPYHPKLLEAVKQMSNLASKINESKRQKDLVLKYRKDADQTIGDRLSKLNLHSMRKKSSRFGYRLSTTIGITQLERDELFESIEKNFRSIEKLFRTLLRDLQIYCDRIQHIVEQQLLLCDTWRELIGKNQLLFNYYTAWKYCIDSIIPQFFANITLRTKQPIENALHLFDGPNKLIAKRFDKLIDYESIKTTEKTTPTEHGRIKRGEYEALNSQLKSELPMLVNIAENVYNTAIRSLLSTQQNFYIDTRTSFMHIYKDRQKLTQLDIHRRFESSFQLAFEDMKLSISTSNTNRLSMIDQHMETSKRQSVALTGSNRQTESDRDRLRSRYASDCLYTVVGNNSNNVIDTQFELNVTNGDLVGVIIRKDPLGNIHRWYCDNGICKGFVAEECLMPVDKYDSMSTNLITIDRQVTVSPATTTSIASPLMLIDLNTTTTDVNTSSINNRNSHCDDLIGLQMTTPVGNSTFYYSPPSSSSTQQQQSKLMPLYSNTTSQLLHQPVEMKQQKPVDPFQNLWQEAKSNLTYWKLSNQQQCVVENSLLLSKSNQQPSTSSRSDEIAKSTSAIIPIRPAPPPPSMSIDDDTVTNEYNRHNDIEFYIAEYSFDAEDSNQLSIVEGQTVAVHTKHDQDGNVDWWLVEDDSDATDAFGYVPANYLRPILRDDTANAT